MLKERTLEHRQSYQYKVHVPKLALTATAIPADVAAKVKNYLLSVFDRFPDVLFRDDHMPNLDEQAGPRRRRSALSPITVTSRRVANSPLSLCGCERGV